ncbi:predicted protein [Lichtheimia corymbifera JMRC:FSU:9682]|uniref:Uncharacterized protein n=1 Tax=Lichtheimia corymbifera JMRC:FSU:9682 TaxID=1263082 RepID=A0A068RV56_9FUNG|nr:predicted protein [Lichtheimia corymbifera JMRC:FSU:9682]
MWTPPMRQYDPRSASCPSIPRPDPLHTSQKASDIFPPEAPPDYYYYAHRSTPAGSSTTSSSTVVADESMTSVVTHKGAISSTGSYGSEQSEWLRRRRRFSSRSRLIFCIIGMIVFLLIITSTIVWIGNMFILPQVEYTTRYSQNTDHHHPSSISSNHTTAMP